MLPVMYQQPSMSARAWFLHYGIAPKPLVDMLHAHGKGRMRCPTARQDRYIWQVALRELIDFRQEALLIDFRQATNVSISEQDVRSRLTLRGKPTKQTSTSTCNTVQPDLNLPGITWIGSCTTGVLLLFTTKSPRVTDV